MQAYDPSMRLILLVALSSCAADSLDSPHARVPCDLAPGGCEAACADFQTAYEADGPACSATLASGMTRRCSATFAYGDATGCCVLGTEALYAECD